MSNMWMVRAEGGQFYDDFREREVAGIGWSELAEHVKPGMSRTAIVDLYLKVQPQTKKRTAIAGASQVWRFLNEIEAGDPVVTYSPSNRTYMIGTFTGPAVHHSEWSEDHMSLARQVKWLEREIPRDDLSQPTKNSLGSTLTVFQLSDHATRELLAQKGGTPARPVDENELIDSDDDEAAVDPLDDIESQALERIKDMVSALDWSDMQELVAGILRAMGYKTQVSPAGSDRGKDIIASPDGFGFENPRIVVEVKHRRGAMGSQAIRSFLGGRHKDDRGLYVSTGGFSRDAHYEADRASVPLALWTVDNLVRALVEHSGATDTETKRLVPLKRTYWPA
jgi:restriction system protein